MPTLEDALELAIRAHKGQVDKAGQAYIFHPLRVMMRMTTETEKFAAILHDVVEDTDMTLDDLRVVGYPEPVITAVDCLTKRDGEAYDAYIDRVLTNPVACRVKLGDLEDNMDIRRNKKVKSSSIERLEKYRKAWHRIASHISDASA